MVIVMAMRRALGFVRFEAEGVFCERFLNLAAERGIDIRDPVKSGISMRANVLARDYAKLRAPARKAGVKLHIVSRRGLPFWLRRNSRRAGLAMGAVFFAAALFIMSQFIWEVRVSGNESVDAETILTAAEASGLKAGVWREAQNIQAIESALLINIKELSWVAVNLNGSVADLVVRESTPAPRLFHDDDVPTNIVAAKTGIIRRMEVYDGASVVKVGDAVTEGSLLVSAVIEDEYKQLTLKHARAKIFAETEYEIDVSFPLEQTLERRTGRVINHRTIEFFGAEIPLWFGEYEGAAQESLETSRLSLLWLPLQITVKNVKIYPVEKHKLSYTEEQAKGGALQRLEEREAVELADAEIISKKTSGGLEDGCFVLKAAYRCVMDIAREEPLLSKTPWSNTDSWS